MIYLLKRFSKMGNRVTIQDVANLAGVSKVTVSYVLNGRDEVARISTDTKARVLDAAKVLGYRPSAIARTLATQRSQTIAVVFQYGSYFSHWSSFTSDVMHGVCEAAVEYDFDLMLHTRMPGSSEQESMMLTDGRADGVLLLRDGNDPLIHDLVQRDFPAVLFFTRSYLPDAAFVDADNYAGGRIATQHLLELGHSRIGMIRGSLQSVSSNDRFNGYREALENHGLQVNPEHGFVVSTPNESLEAVRNCIRSKDRPTAFFIWSDDVAYQVMEMIQMEGLSIPSDISIVGFDSLSQSNLCRPQLTSIKQPITEMARDAATMLVQLIDRTPMKRKQRIYPLTLDIRASTAPPVF